MAKTILFAGAIPFHPEFGGVERVTDILAHEFVRRGYRVLYLYHEQRDGIPPYDYPAELFNKLDFKDVTSYHNFLRDQGVDIIINQDGAYNSINNCLSIGKNLKIKRIAVIHHNPALNYDSLAEQYFKPKDKLFILRWLRIMARVILFLYLKLRYRNERVSQYRFLGNNCELICLLSEQFRTALHRFAPQIPENQIIAIANPNTYTKQNTELLNHKSKQLLYVGRLIMNQKRPDRLFEIWRQLMGEFPDWELVIVGDGVDREYLERRAKGLPRVRFEGRQDPKPYYEKSPIFCMTSNHEGFPMVLAEAMAHGAVPILFDSFASAKDIIYDGESGIFVTPFSINEYAEKLRGLMRDEDRRVDMAKCAMERVARFDVSQIVDRWEEIF